MSSDPSLAAEIRQRDDAWRRVDPVALLRAVIAEGLERSLWSSTTAFALETIVTEPRKVRGWLAYAGDDRSLSTLGMREAVFDRLVALAEQMGLEPWPLLRVGDPA